VSVIWDIWRKYGQSEVLRGGEVRASIEPMEVCFNSSPLKGQQWGM
jgi:hypothetical protein